MNRTQSFGTRLTLWAVFTSFIFTAALPSKVHAEILAGTANVENTYAIKEIKRNIFEIKNSENALTLEVVPGDGSLIKINGQSYTLDLGRSRRWNEQRLAQFLSQNIISKSERSPSALSYLENLLMPQAHALNWWAIGLGIVGLAGIIIGIVAMNKSKKKNNGDNDKSAKYAAEIETYEKRIDYQMCMGRRYGYGGGSHESCDGSYK